MMERHPDRTRASIDTDGTVYVSNGWQAARYIPVRLLADYSADTCPGCGTPYATNGDGPCEGGRSPLAPGSRDYDAEAAALLGDGESWVRHGYSGDGKLSSVNGMNRREALQTVVSGLKHGEVLPAPGRRGVRVVFPAAKSAYWLEPVTVQPNPEGVEEAEERGMPKGPHRIVSTGDDIEHTAGDGGKYGVAAFECTRCHKRAILADFEYGRVEKCTDKAEAEWSRECADALLNDRTFKGATAYAFTSPDEHGQPRTHTYDLATAREALALWERARGKHSWYRGELRVTCFGAVHSVRPVIEEQHDRPAADAERHGAACDAEETRVHAQAQRDRAVNNLAKFLPQDPADESTRPCVQLIDGTQVDVYRKGGRLVVSVDVDTAQDTRDDGTVPMVIMVQGETVYES
jgi:hypothetical protein